MKPGTKKLLTLGFILLTLAVVLFIGFRNGDLAASLNAILNMPKGWVALCVLCTFGAILMECLSLGSALSTLGHSLTLIKLYTIAVLGEFYSYVTPGASGGQPMQVYQLHRDRVPVGDSTAALTIHFHAFQLTMLTGDVILFIRHHAFIRETLGPNLPFLILGFFANAVLVSGSLLIAFYQRPIRWLLKVASRLTRRFRIGSADRLEGMLNDLADGYYGGMRRLVSDPGEIVRQLCCALVRLTLMMSIPYLLYRGLGQSSASYGRVFALSCMQYTSAAYTPLPGASGAQEGIFSLYFGSLLPGELLFSALLAWRFITYYLVLIVGSFVTTALGMSGKSVEEVQSEIAEE